MCVCVCVMLYVTHVVWGQPGAGGGAGRGHLQRLLRPLALLAGRELRQRPPLEHRPTRGTEGLSCMCHVDCLICAILTVLYARLLYMCCVLTFLCVPCSLEQLLRPLALLLGREPCQQYYMERELNSKLSGNEVYYTNH